MKKLMVALMAVALGSYAMADDATPASLTGEVSFSTETDGQWTVEGKDNWSYNGEAGTLNINSGALDIQTGTKRLSRSVATDNNAIAIKDANATRENIYIDTVIDFKNQVLDDVPTVNEGDKIAIFILDNSDLEGVSDDVKGTNVYVMAGYGSDGKTALYRLSESAIDHIIATPQRVVVKSYDNVVQGMSRSGFLVSMLDADATAGTAINPIGADKVYVITDGVVNWTNVMTTSDYLGGITTTATVSKWSKIDKAALFLSMMSDSTTEGKLTAVDYVGNAKISSIKVTNSISDFVPDAATMTIVKGDNIDNIEVTSPTDGSVSYDGSGVLTSTAAESSVTLKVTAKDGYSIIKADGTELTDGTYTFTFNNGGTISFEAYQVAATIGDTQYATLADAITAVNSAADDRVLKLGTNVSWPTTTDGAMSFNKENITLDLNGKVLNIENGSPLTISGGQLTITDNSDSKTGKVQINDAENEDKGGVYVSGGTLTIEKGIFDCAVFVDTSITATIKGGSFKKAYNSTDVEPDDTFSLKSYVAEGYAVVAEGDYWVVSENQEPQMVTLTIVNDNNATIKKSSSEDSLTNGDVTVGDTISFTVNAKEGYKVSQVTVTNSDSDTVEVSQDSTTGVYSFTVPAKNVTLTVMTEDLVKLTVSNDSKATISVTEGGPNVETGWYSANTAFKFSLIVEDGYEVDSVQFDSESVTAEDGVYMIMLGSTEATLTITTRTKIDPVTPGQESSAYESKDEAEKVAAAINADLVNKVVIPSPEGSELTVEQKNTYASKVSAMVTSDNRVVVDFKDENIKSEFQNQLNTEVAKQTVAEALTTPATTEASVETTVPGFYYWVEGGTEVSMIDQPGEAKVGNGSTLSLSKPKFDGATKAFYRLKVGVKAPTTTLAK